MGFTCGLVGLPNAGKSTLFGALTRTKAQSGNYAFTTIEPNSGIVPVPDRRLDVITSYIQTKKIVPTTIEFVDIAGLIKGASKGEGLGNKFLGHIREVDAICHVVRCFKEDDITHVEGTIDSVRDAETIETELLLADLDMVEKRFESIEKKARGGDKSSKRQLTLLSLVLNSLKEGEPVRKLNIPDDLKSDYQSLQLLTAKPVLFVGNVDENSAGTGNDYSNKLFDMAKKRKAECVIVSAAIESEVAQLSSINEQHEFLSGLGLNETGLTRVIKSGYQLLDLITFLTAGPKEARAWTVPKGALAPEAAGKIHSDFQKGFIRAETINYDELINYSSYNEAKDSGKIRLEGKEYEVKDGDIMNFRFNN